MTPLQSLGGIERKNWKTRHALWLVGLAVLPSQVIGSGVNIWYNLGYIQPLLKPAQFAALQNAIPTYNFIVYPALVLIWALLVASLNSPFKRCLHHQPLSPQKLLSAQKRVIHLPWWSLLLTGTGWLLCIPIFLWVLIQAPGALAVDIFIHLPVSILISTLIALTHGFFTVEILSQRLLYPIFFQAARPSDLKGTFALSLQGRGLLWAISAGVCPILSLMLLSLTIQMSPVMPTAEKIGSETATLMEDSINWFPLMVGLVGIGFGLITAWMLIQLVVQPVQALQRAARSVSAGDLQVHIPLLRADEFGPLINEFNDMVLELREKQRLQETFGRHVGLKAAQQIMQRDPGLGGVEQTITVLFTDLRNFTARSEQSSPQETVALLNLFLTAMVEIVEHRHGGMVNKFLGDGFMALFGVDEYGTNHPTQAVAAGQDMLTALTTINQTLQHQGRAPLEMGIGIHTGPVVVGSIGSPQRSEYTAVGNTVNIASRVESLTKVLQTPLLVTSDTFNGCKQAQYPKLEAIPPQWVKGRSEPLQLYRLK